GSLPVTSILKDYMVNTLNAEHRKNPAVTVPFYICGDISHGLANKGEKVIHSNTMLFEYAIPYMAEFHFKNTDSIFHSTFGFSDGEIKKGVIDLNEMKELIYRNSDKWPVEEVVGYLGIPGPKLGRDYSDYKLKKMLEDSLGNLKRVFGKKYNEVH
ncbi:MAG: hypothetical protein AB1798_11620, partial [Spirochaetota bacterium]